MRRKDVGGWIDDAVGLFREAGYDDIDALEAVRDLVQGELEKVEDAHPQLKYNWSVIADVFEGVYRKAVGR